MSDDSQTVGPQQNGVLSWDIEGGYRYTRETPRWERIDEVKIADDGIPFFHTSRVEHHEIDPETRQSVYEAFGGTVATVLVTTDAEIKKFGDPDE